MGNLQGDNAAVSRIGGAEDRGHAAFRDGRVDAIGIDLRSRLKNIEITHRDLHSIVAFFTVSGEGAGIRKDCVRQEPMKPEIEIREQGPEKQAWVISAACTGVHGTCRPAPLSARESLVRWCYRRHRFQLRGRRFRGHLRSIFLLRSDGGDFGFAHSNSSHVDNYVLLRLARPIDFLPSTARRSISFVF